METATFIILGLIAAAAYYMFFHGKDKGEVTSYDPKNDRHIK